jgi:hypothetical protein
MEYSSVFGNHDLEFEDVDFLLKRDWALYVEDVDELLWTIRQDVFDQILENRVAYPCRVRELLDWYARDGTSKVGDLNDDEMDAILNGDDEERIRIEKEEFETYTPPQRPRNIIDERNDQLKNLLLRRNLTVEDRRILENEFEESNKRLTSENRSWKELQWINAKLADARHISL